MGGGGREFGVVGPRRSFWQSLSGRFLLLTGAFVLLAEVLILLPAVAGFRMDYLELRLEKAQIASLALLASPDDMLTPELEAELLANAQVFNVVLRRNEVRQLVLNSPLPAPVYETFDLRMAGPFAQLRDALRCLVTPDEQVIRIIGAPVQGAGDLIEITMETAGLRQGMIDYALRVFLLSAPLSALTAALLFLAVRRLMLMPIRRVVDHMQAYAAAPEDGRRIIAPTARVGELRDAEESLAALQRDLSAALRQKERLAQLGGAVARISHDLRNILTSAQLFADRIEESGDPRVAGIAPKLIASIRRAVGLTEKTLAFGRADEQPPQFARLPLRPLCQEVAEAEGLSVQSEPALVLDIPPSLTLRADGEQLFRVLSNLVRNARQAIEAAGAPGTIEIAGGEDEEAWWIAVGDTGPGLPAKAREHLFTPFQGGARKGGTGLGLAIADELVRGHGGKLTLEKSGESGSLFRIRLPKSLWQNGEEPDAP